MLKRKTVNFIIASIMRSFAGVSRILHFWLHGLPMWLSFNPHIEYFVRARPCSTIFLIDFGAICKHLIIVFTSGEDVHKFILGVIEHNRLTALVITFRSTLFNRWIWLAAYAMAIVGRTCDWKERVVVYVGAHFAFGLEAFPASERSKFLWIVLHFDDFCGNLCQI